jgi:hypothetical protein
MRHSRRASARRAALHGLLLGLVLQALLVGAIEIAGAPIRPEAAALSVPPAAAVAQARH